VALGLGVAEPDGVTDAPVEAVAWVADASALLVATAEEDTPEGPDAAALLAGADAAPDCTGSVSVAITDAGIVVKPMTETAGSAPGVDASLGVALGETAAETGSVGVPEGTELSGADAAGVLAALVAEALGPAESALLTESDGPLLVAEGDRLLLAVEGDGSPLAAEGDGSLLAAEGDKEAADMPTSDGEGALPDAGEGSAGDGVGVGALFADEKMIVSGSADGWVRDPVAAPAGDPVTAAVGDPVPAAVGDPVAASGGDPVADPVGNPAAAAEGSDAGEDAAPCDPPAGAFCGLAGVRVHVLSSCTKGSPLSPVIGVRVMLQVSIIGPSRVWIVFVVCTVVAVAEVSARRIVKYVVTWESPRAMGNPLAECKRFKRALNERKSRILDSPSILQAVPSTVDRPAGE